MMLTFAFLIAEVDKCLSPHNRIILQYLDFSAFSCAVKIYTVVFFIVPMIKGYKIWFIFITHSKCHISATSKNFLYFRLICNFLVFSS